MEFNRIAPTSKGPGIVPIYLSRSQLVRLLDIFSELPNRKPDDEAIFNQVRGELLITLEGDIRDIQSSDVWLRDPDRQFEEIQYLLNVIEEVRRLNPFQARYSEPMPMAEPPISDVNDHRGWADFAG
ncbi:MAG TPA: hypothetical protein V6D11_14845 [Waterburya sp.]|jgi:hypothetical protein